MERLVDGGREIGGGQGLGKGCDSVSTSVETELGRLELARENKRQIGIFSASLLIFNRTIGTAIFATPATILSLSGSIGLSLMLWLTGMVIALAGTAVYMELGTGLPRNGGEKNYLEYVYRRPRLLTTSLYTGYVLLLGWAAGNSVIFGEYILHAARVETGRWNQRAIALGCLTAAFLIHGLALKWGIRVQNALGILKIGVILIIIIAPLFNLAKVRENTNFRGHIFEGTTVSAYGIVTALYNVIWSFVGYSNANYALSETRNPTYTLKYAAPLGIGTISVLYILANVSYFAVVSKEDIIDSKRLVAASLFRNVFGEPAERALSVFVALSALGNVMSVIFSQGRLVQELGREGILPFSRLWASNRPFNAPLAGLFQHWLITSITVIAPPAGDAYNFVLNLISYPLAIINVFVAGALIHLYRNRDTWQWNPPLKATLPVVIFFLLSNIYLVVAPFVPPENDSQSIYDNLPYWIHCAVGFGVILAGGLYWLVWAVLMPKLGRYELVRETVVDSFDGWERTVFIKRPLAVADHAAPQPRHE
ncbi:hypothetical protein XA68_15359 [Ophiocordyceps unilateralis]|uniref:Amino acid permease/ SLC12A domain-containing protein n=1 Tax=Ophiocordyceps unilateralis TaxID=268505 RepID=A0A2A9PMJ5_OPHUN|nr:hypothetical protein XA68_15359 [Ophiocordyceps unilateralis]